MERRYSGSRGLPEDRPSNRTGSKGNSCPLHPRQWLPVVERALTGTSRGTNAESDRKSTRLNSSHLGISYAVFCLKKKTALARHPRSVARLRPVCLPRRNSGRATQTHDPRSSEQKNETSCANICFFFNGTGPPGILPPSPAARLPI